jgi:hypothetical protein
MITRIRSLRPPDPERPRFLINDLLRSFLLAVVIVQADPEGRVSDDCGFWLPRTGPGAGTVNRVQRLRVRNADQAPGPL